MAKCLFRAIAATRSRRHECPFRAIRPPCPKTLPAPLRRMFPYLQPPSWSNQKITDTNSCPSLLNCFLTSYICDLFLKDTFDYYILSISCHISKTQQLMQSQQQNYKEMSWQNCWENPEACPCKTVLVLNYF